MNIPDGWRKLLTHEVILKGDKFMDVEDGEEWEECQMSIGEQVSDAFTPDDYIVIRKLPAQQPQEDKEWRNPWD